MSVVTVVATVEPNNVPPRVRLDVTDTGTPAITAANVIRIQSDGRTRNVRTFDGNPLQLVTSGSDRVGTVYDYEVPFGLPVRYSTLETPANQTADITVNSGFPWLIHPGVPALSQPVDFRVDSFSTVDADVERGVFRPLGRENAVVVTDGQRKSDEGEFTVGTETLIQFRAIKALLADAGVLFLNVPESLGLAIDTAYISVGRVQYKRRSNIGTDPYRDTVMPYMVVDMPVGGSQAQRTYADVLAESATYSALLANTTKFPTYAAVLAPAS